MLFLSLSLFAAADCTTEKNLVHNAPTGSQSAGRSKPVLDANNPPYAKATNAIVAATQGMPSASLLRAFILDSQRVNNRIDTTTVTEADNDRVDRAVEEYRALADRLSGRRYDGIPSMQKQAMLQGLRQNFDGIAERTDEEITYARSLITGLGRADAAYNYLIVQDAYLYAGEKLFPRRELYAAARAKLAIVLEELGGSRDGARAVEEAAEVAAARNVHMPPPTTLDPSVISMFRTAWRTSGIPWEIVKIHPTSGWYDRREYGRVVGQLRDAAIAARDPANPDRCNLYDFTLFRDLSGNVRRSSHSTKRIACENVE